MIRDERSSSLLRTVRRRRAEGNEANEAYMEILVDLLARWRKAGGR
jgi:hypothetical protein